MSLPDVAFFRSFCHVKNFNGQPAVRYFFPADAVSCYKITELMANIDGTCYQRALRAETKMLYKPEETFEVGGYKVLREGKDLVFVTAGYMVHECLKAADELAKNGKKAGGDRRLWSAAEGHRHSGHRRQIRRPNHHRRGQLHRRPGRRDRRCRSPTSGAGSSSKHCTSTRFPRAAASRRKCWITCISASRRLWRRCEADPLMER